MPPHLEEQIAQVARHPRPFSITVPWLSCSIAAKSAPAQKKSLPAPVISTHADCLVNRPFRQRAPNLGDHFMAEGVALFGTVERDTSDTLVNGVQDFAIVAHVNRTGIPACPWLNYYSGRAKVSTADPDGIVIYCRPFTM